MRVCGEYMTVIVPLRAKPNWCSSSVRCWVMSLSGLVLGWRSAYCFLILVMCLAGSVCSVYKTGGALQRPYASLFSCCSA